MKLEAVIFDYDGTLVHLNIDFEAMRRGVDRLFESYGLDPGGFRDLHLLEAIDKAARTVSRKDRAAGRSLQEEAMGLLRDEEVRAAKEGRVLPGALRALETLRRNGIRVGIITRNCEEAVRIAFPRVEEVCDVFIPRDHVAHVKPHPVHLRLAMERMAVVRPECCLMVGDHVIDVEAGKRIGMQTAGVLTGHTTAEKFVDAGADLVLEDAVKVLDHVLTGEKTVRNKYFPSGKLDIRTLNRLLQRYARSDRRVVVGPRIGEDTAAIDMGEKLLIVTTDPITFATDEIGYYSVVVNANDIATSGAQPKWLTMSILLPESRSDKALVDRIFRQIHRACEEFEISLVGGHLEITPGLDRPILIGQMMGEVGKDALITTRGAEIGDDVLLSKGLSVEGTSLIAREREKELLSRGISRSLVQRAKGFLYDPGISVIREARIACESGHVHSMHDVTEGGLANGLHELALAAGVRIVVEEERIPIFDETRILCEAFDLNPLGLIASGALLLTAAPREARKILDRASSEGVSVTRIGYVTKGRPSVILVTSHGSAPFARFPRDEIVKVFEDPS